MISLVMASRNGMQTLPRMFTSLLELKAPAEGWEFIAVDSASDDGTLEFLQSQQPALPMSVLRSDKPGKNRALNTAMKQVSGSLVVFTDDDVILPPNFLVDYAELAAAQPEYDLFGGGIVADWETEPAPGIIDDIPPGTAFSITDPDRAAGPIEANMLYGPNFAARMRIFELGLSYDESVGPSRGEYIMGSETSFLQDAEHRGHKAYFEPEIIVGHRVWANQLGKQWIGTRGARAGRTMLHRKYRSKTDYGSISTVFGYPRWAVGATVKNMARQFFLAVRGTSTGYLGAVWQANFHRGYAMEFKKLKRLEDQQAK